MQKITQITEADVGRIAVSKNGRYRVRVKAVNHDRYAVVEHLIEADGALKGDISANFLLVRGALDMFWEDEMNEEVKKPTTPFEIWCDKNGYDPKGEFVFDIEETEPEYINSMFSIGDVLKLIFDDGSACPRFASQDRVKGYEDFDKSGRVVLKPRTAKRLAKPRFHKPRKKPPVRKKTDVVVHYKTGESYTIKNVDSVTINNTFSELSSTKVIEKGIRTQLSQVIDKHLISALVIKTPKGHIVATNCNNDWVINSGMSCGVCSQWCFNDL